VTVFGRLALPSPVRPDSVEQAGWWRNRRVL
jgi:hypothetical protein